MRTLAAVAMFVCAGCLPKAPAGLGWNVAQGKIALSVLGQSETPVVCSAPLGASWAAMATAVRHALTTEGAAGAVLGACRVKVQLRGQHVVLSLEDPAQRMSVSVTVGQAVSLIQSFSAAAIDLVDPTPKATGDYGVWEDRYKSLPPCQPAIPNAEVYDREIYRHAIIEGRGEELLDRMKESPTACRGRVWKLLQEQ